MQTTKIQNRFKRVVEKFFHNFVFRLFQMLFMDDNLIDKDVLKVEVGELLKKRNLTFSTAESCTGGAIAAAVTSVPGSSDYFKGSVVSYCNEVKHHVLGVRLDDLDRFTAVSRPVVEQMAQGVCCLLNTDVAVSVSGVAGPSGGTKKVPVGTIWMAACFKSKVVSRCFHFGLDRSENIQKAVSAALMLVKEVIGNQIPEK